MAVPADIDELALLAEFAELAMARVRAASRRAEAVEAEDGDPTVHLAAMDRMGRAMRLALSLRRRLADEKQVQAGRRVQARKGELKAALAPAIRLNAPFADWQALEWALAHRLETEADTLTSLPFAEGVERLTRMLGLPDEALPEPAAPGAEPNDDLAPDPDGPRADGPALTLSSDLIDRARRIAARATGPP